jgi:hypothetical protein
MHFVPLSKAGRTEQVRPAQELLEYLGSRGPEDCVRNPPILTPNLRLILLEPRRFRTQDGQICVDENLGVDADRLRGMACEHDEIVDPLCAVSTDAQFSSGVACPIRAPLLIVVTLSVVDHIVEPEANVYLGWMLRQRNDVLDLLEAFSKMLICVIVAMWLGVTIENMAMEASERRGIADS